MNGSVLGTVAMQQSRLIGTLSSTRIRLASWLKRTRFGLQGCPTFGCYSVAIQDGSVSAEVQVALAFDFPSLFVEFDQELMEGGSSVTNDKELFANLTAGPLEVTASCEVYPADGCDGGLVLESEIGRVESPGVGGGLTGKKWTWTWTPFG
jgi:hypothetical protein